MVAEQLIRLVRMDLKTGDKLPSERQLMKQLEVGRSSLREAMRSLEIMGLVETRSGEGTFVNNDKSRIFSKPLEWGVFDGEKSTKDLLEARTVFEVAIVALTAGRITDKELDAIEQTVKKMEQTRPPDLESFLATDLRFHELLVRAAKNDVLYETMSLTYRILDKERTSGISTEEQYRKSASFHRNIFEALRKHDGSAAKEAMDAHMKWTRLLLDK